MFLNALSFFCKVILKQFWEQNVSNFHIFSQGPKFVAILLDPLPFAPHSTTMLEWQFWSRQSRHSSFSMAYFFQYWQCQNFSKLSIFRSSTDYQTLYWWFLMSEYQKNWFLQHLALLDSTALYSPESLWSQSIRPVRASLQNSDHALKGEGNE